MTSNLLVCNEDLEGSNDLSERDALVCLPVVCSLNILNEDDEVLVLALVVNLGLCRHTCGSVEGLRFGLKRVGVRRSCLILIESRGVVLFVCVCYKEEKEQKLTGCRGVL